MSEIQFPAQLVLSALRRNGKAEVVSFADSLQLNSDADLQARLAMFRALEESGCAGYNYTLAEVANVAAVIAEQRRRLEYEAGLRDSPDPDPEPEPAADPLQLAAELARAKWAGDAAMLARIDKALDLVNAGAVKELGGGQWAVTGQSGRTYTVNGACQCADYTHRGGYCKHRLAVCLVRKARELTGNGAESAVNTSAPEAPTSGDTTQEQSTTSLDLSQLAEARPLWGGGGLELTDLDGKRIVRRDLTEAAAAPVLRAAGWEGPIGQGYWRNPGARDWAALDAQIKAQCAAMIGRWQARQATA